MAPVWSIATASPMPSTMCCRITSAFPITTARAFPIFFPPTRAWMRDFKVTPKYAVRLSVTGFNLTNHFNALAIHDNIADPQFGVFFGNYHRRYRFDFDVHFLKHGRLKSRRQSKCQH